MDIHQEFTDRIEPTINKPHADLPFEPNVASCQEWADSLPILNPQTTAEMISNATLGLLSINIDDIKKFNLLEIINPCLIKLLSTSAEAAENVNLPLSKKLSDLSSKTLQVLANTGSIYMDIACSTRFMAMGEKTDSPPFSNEQKTRVLHNAIELLGMAQLFKSLLYMQVDNSFWNDTNAIFSLAEKLRIHQTQSPTLDGDRTTSIEDEFKKIHFFHLAQPNRFRQRDINAIQRILSLHVSSISISHTPDKHTEFYIDLSSSSAISTVPNSISKNDHYRFINNDELVSFMQSDQVIAPENHGTISLVSDQPILPKQTANQLLSSWSTSSSRKTPRHEQIEEITVYPGFDSILKALIIKRNPHHFNEKLPEEKKSSIDFEIENLHLVPLEDHQKNQHTFNDLDMNRVLKATAENSLSADNIWKKKRPVKPGEKGEAMNAEMKDSSLQGLRFEVPSDNKALLKVNDLIGIETTDNPLQLAIIRRLNHLNEGVVTVGVEMMSPHLKIANITFKDKERSPEAVIFLQGIPAINQPDSSITPLSLESTYEDIVLKVKDTVSHYQIDKSLETNQVFIQYEVLKKANLD